MPKYYVESGYLKKIVDTPITDTKEVARMAFRGIDRAMLVAPVVLVSERGFGSDRFLSPVYDYALYHYPDEPLFSTLEVVSE